MKSIHTHMWREPFLFFFCFFRFKTFSLCLISGQKGSCFSTGVGAMTQAADTLPDPGKYTVKGKHAEHEYDEPAELEP